MALCWCHGDKIVSSYLYKIRYFRRSFVLQDDDLMDLMSILSPKDGHNQGVVYSFHVNVLNCLKIQPNMMI